MEEPSPATSITANNTPPSSAPASLSSATEIQKLGNDVFQLQKLVYDLKVASNQNAAHVESLVNDLTAVVRGEEPPSESRKTRHGLRVPFVGKERRKQVRTARTPTCFSCYHV